MALSQQPKIACDKFWNDHLTVRLLLRLMQSQQATNRNAVWNHVLMSATLALNPTKQTSCSLTWRQNPLKKKQKRVMQIKRAILWSLGQRFIVSFYFFSFQRRWMAYTDDVLFSCTDVRRRLWLGFHIAVCTHQLHNTSKFIRLISYSVAGCKLAVKTAQCVVSLTQLWI